MDLDFVILQEALNDLKQRLEADFGFGIMDVDAYIEDCEIKIEEGRFYSELLDIEYTWNRNLSYVIT